MSSTSGNSSKNNRRRFNDDQVHSLETTFESESRPELRLKQQLANKLGLQPRQIAIWFQNKRARSKSKQIERDYSILKSNYDKLASEFEALMKENQALLTQVQRLRNMAEKSDGGEDENKNQITSANSEKPRFVDDIINSHEELCVPLDDANNVMRTGEIGEGSLASPEKGCSFECCTFLGNSGTTSTSSQWWDFSSLEI